MRAFLAVMSSLAIVLAAGCSTNKSQPQSSTVYVPEPAAPSSSEPASMTTNTPPSPTVQPIVDAPANAQSITISKVVWDNFQAYLAKVGRVGDGFYAVTEDGSGGGSWACGEALCLGNFDGQGAALKSCADANAGKTCIIFARDNKIRMKYTVAE
jgi:hypothetical protein